MHRPNLLPHNGNAHYCGKILSQERARRAFDRLLSDIPWAQDEVLMFGKRIVTARKVAWYGDEPFAYTYSGTTREAQPWTEDLLDLKRTVEDVSQASYNSCLLNLYHHGMEGMAWHSDDEATMGKDCPIASLSLGAERTFSFKHRLTGEKVSLILEDGSLLVMRDETQNWWLHSLPKTRRITTARINLTFRTFVPEK